MERENPRYGAGSEERGEPEDRRNLMDGGKEAEHVGSVDVVIPVFRPGEKFHELLRRLLAQTYPIGRIIIMNTERGYWREEEYLPLFEDRKTQLTVHHLAKSEFDHGRTRDQGIRDSRAEICICMTQDAIPADRYLVERLARTLIREETAAAVYARQLPASGCGAIERYTRAFNYPEESRVKTLADLDEMGIKTYFCSNVCAAYRREVYLRLGGFIQKTVFNEDMIFAAKAVKAGYAIAYAAEARVIHSHNYNAVEQIRRNFDLAVSQADHPEVFSGIASEGEGIRLVRRTAHHLISGGEGYLLPKLVIQSGCKYLGFLLGKNYRRLPGTVIRKLTMNAAYWESD